jgi:DNA polymerase (family X)
MSKKELTWAAASKFLAKLIKATKLALKPAGSYRRAMGHPDAVLGDLDLLTCHDLGDVIAAIANKMKVKWLVRGPLRASFKVEAEPRLSIQVDIFRVLQGEGAPSLLHWTGPKSSNIKLRRRAIELGLKLNQHGLFKTGDGSAVAGMTSERAIYKALGLNYVEPKNRK